MVAGDGVRYRQWHTTALFSPRRSCLPTGCNNTRNSMAYITEGDSGFASASGTIPRENGMPGGYMLAGKALAISLDVGVPVSRHNSAMNRPLKVDPMNHVTRPACTHRGWGSRSVQGTPSPGPGRCLGCSPARR